MSSADRDARTAAIAEALAAAWAGPWSWSKSYELGDARHWCLHNAESDAEGKCIDGFLVLATTVDRSYDGTPLDETPNFRLIANAPEYIAFLLAELRAALSREAAWKAAHDRLFCGSVSLSENG